MSQTIMDSGPLVAWFSTRDLHREAGSFYRLNCASDSTTSRSEPVFRETLLLECRQLQLEQALYARLSQR
jgi:hypothetical protein